MSTPTQTLNTISDHDFSLGILHHLDPRHRRTDLYLHLTVRMASLSDSSLITSQSYTIITV